MNLPRYAVLREVNEEHLARQGPIPEVFNTPPSERVSRSRVILRSGPANSETAEMGVLTYLGWLVLAGVETRWNVMGGCPPSRMQKLYLASCGRHDELGM